MNEHINSDKGQELLQTIKDAVGDRWLRDITDNELNYFVRWFLLTGLQPSPFSVGQAFRGFVKGLELAKSELVTIPAPGTILRR